MSVKEFKKCDECVVQCKVSGSFIERMKIMKLPTEQAEALVGHMWAIMDMTEYV